MNKTIVVTDDAAETRLTTLERVKSENSIVASTNDTLLLAKIDEASSDIAVRCGPSLRRETVTETFYPDGCRECVAKLILSRYPVVSVDSVTLDDEVVDSAEYRIDKASGLLYHLTTDGYPRDWSFGKSIIVEYTAGYLLPGEQGRDLPYSLEAACVELVSSYWMARGRDPMLRSETNEGVASFTYWVGAVGEAGDLPPGVMAKIAPYRKVVFA